LRGGANETTATNQTEAIHMTTATATLASISANIRDTIARRTELLHELGELETNLLRLLEIQQALVAPAQEPTVVEPEPAQEKAEANARVALANKGKSAKEKAEALDTTPATVRKVEKAKAKALETTHVDYMKADALKKLAKELGVDFSQVKFNSSSQREAFRQKLKETMQSKSSPVWQGLSASRQAQLDKMSCKN
jgi:transcriptional regulator with XRE-family HTH domain